MGGFLSAITGIGGLKDLVLGVLDKIKLDPTKKAEIQAQMEQNTFELQKIEADIRVKEQQYQENLVNSQKEIIIAEMGQGDNFTKRARPSIVYAGLLFIFINHVLPAIVTYAGGKQTPVVDLPANFWNAWELVVSVWAVGRTAERLGATNKVTKLITGKK